MSLELTASAKYMRKYRATHPEYVKKQRIKEKEYKKLHRVRRKKIARLWTLKQFGLTQEDYIRLFEKQNGVCAICGKPETRHNQHGVCPLAVDHNHNTGEVRGLLCHKCNMAIGLLYVDDLKATNVIKVLKYIRK